MSMEYDDLLKDSSYVHQIILRGKHEIICAISLHNTKTMTTHESIYFPILTIFAGLKQRTKEKRD